MDTAVGADAWPSGLHVWNGNSAPSTPNPMKMTGNHILCIFSGMLCRAAISVISIVVAPAPKYMPSMPMSMRADPPMSIRVSFIAEYSFRPVPQTPMSRYIGMSATS